MEFSMQKYKNLVGDMRLDPEAYLSIYNDIEVELKKKKCTTIGNESESYKKGIFDINSEYYSLSNLKNTIPFVRILNLKNMVIDTKDIVYIPEIEHKKNYGTALFKNDIVLSKTAIPACSLITLEECNTSQDTIAIKLKKESAIRSHFLVVFLNSFYGINQMKRWFTGNIQMHLNLTDSKKTIIPILNQKFQYFIEVIFEKVLYSLEQTKTLYNKASDILVSEVSLYNYPKNNLYNIKNYSETENANRLDAEYFQPKYDEVIRSIKNYSNGYNKLKNIVKIKDTNFIPKSNEEYKYIELANIAKSGEINDCTVDFGENLPTRARRIVSTGDVVVSSIEGSLDSVALITSNNNNALCSTGFYVINSNSINAETLFCLMKSEFIQMQLKRGCSGTILTAINKDEFENIILPKINNNIQIQIKENIQEMYKLKCQSKQLLEIAKRGVEIAIEQDEDIATRWINQELQKLDIKL